MDPEILLVQHKIAEVEAALETLSTNIDQEELTNGETARLIFLRGEKSQLRAKESQLRAEKSQLLELQVAREKGKLSFIFIFPFDSSLIHLLLT